MHFFPSRNITMYMARLFVTRSLAVLAMLVLVLMALDLLGESGKILAVSGNDQGDVLRYIGMRTPQIIARFLPFSVLLGTIITFTTLSQNSEVVAMKAAGLSAHQILAPMFVASFAVAIVSFVFNDAVVAPSTAKLKVWQAVDYGPVPAETGIKTNVWVREGDDLINAGTVSGTGRTTRLGNVSLYLRINGGLRQVIKADEARFNNSGWELENASSFDVTTTEVRKFARLTVGKGITPDRFNYVKVDGDSLGFFPLMDAISDLKAAGRRTDNLEGILWHKLSGPLSTLLMFLRAVIGMALGFAYFVADNFALAMGNLGAYPPWIAAWGPFFLFLLIGETVLVRTEE
jgi:lipopolysaccharide export system permease protein